jgi:hypothetical protein
MLKAVGNYNKFPADFKRPTKLKRGEVVTYKLVEDFRSPDLGSKDPSRPEKFVYPASLKIPTTDTILVGDSVVDIGLVVKVDPETGDVDQLKPIWVMNPHTGEFSFTGGIADQEMQYEYCELCNYNGGREGRDESKKVFFKRVDVEADAKAKTKFFGLRLECMKYVENLTDGDTKKVAASLLLNENESPAVLKAKLYEEAEKDPAKFKKLVESPDLLRKATVKRAINKGVLKYDAPQNKIRWENDEVIATLGRVEGQNHVDQFVEYLSTNKKGVEIYKKIEKLLTGEPAAVEA